jgi:hypothetical protein
MESLSDEYTKGHQCVSFDFMKCSLSELGISYPKLFQFTHEQHMYVSIILYCIFCGTRTGRNVEVFRDRNLNPLPPDILENPPSPHQIP